jgi:cold shock CspA family protein
MQGTVLRYDRAKGFGFILPDDGANLPDYFVCGKFIDPSRRLRFLIPGQRVEFDPIEDQTGFVAHNVRVLPTTIAIQTSGNQSDNVGVASSTNQRKSASCRRNEPDTVRLRNGRLS